jgi:hypothetical protein
MNDRAVTWARVETARTSFSSAAVSGRSIALNS